MNQVLQGYDYNEIEEMLTLKQKRRFSKRTKREKRQNPELYLHSRNTIYVQAKTYKQTLLLNTIKEKDQIISVGPAGTGKTFVATAYAASLLVDKKIKKIVLTRPNVSCSKSIGFLPGDKDEKFSSWTAPFIEVLKECLGQAVFEIYLKRGDIEIVPFEYMRGRTFNDAYVLVDECQSTTVEEMKCLVTRIGSDSKLIMMGDVVQKDIKNYSGLEYVIDSVSKNKNLSEHVGFVEFSVDDVVRSDICSLWVKHIYS